ncbi:MAG TPA: phosphatidate cytidylyltransferase [Pyrinomonadaceae bacterium]|nr:phosphatidate cytidylyltransferase [Pyrinomonadaceae bacterium]
MSKPPNEKKAAAKSSGAARVLTAVIVLPFLIASILVPWLKWLFVALAIAAMALALFEFYVLAKQRGLNPDTGAGFLAATAILVLATFPIDLYNEILLQFVLIVLTAGTLVAATLRGAPFDKMIGSVGSTILGVLYIALLGSYLVSLRMFHDPNVAADVLSFFFLVLMGADAGAYYIGRAFGKHKLAPSISPGKTWEGVAGGIVAALAMATLAHYWFFRELPLKWALPLAAVMTVIGILGDLAESALKRSAGAKDAANILPGHGGLLDRLDSLLFNAPLIYYFARFYFHALNG